MFWRYAIGADWRYRLLCYQASSPKCGCPRTDERKQPIGRTALYIRRVILPCARHRKLIFHSYYVGRGHASRMSPSREMATASRPRVTTACYDAVPAGARLRCPASVKPQSRERGRRMAAMAIDVVILTGEMFPMAGMPLRHEAAARHHLPAAMAMAAIGSGLRWVQAYAWHYASRAGERAFRDSM